MASGVDFRLHSISDAASAGTEQLDFDRRVLLLPHTTQSLAASMSLLNVLAIAVAARNKRKALRQLRRLDTIEQQYLK